MQSFIEEILKKKYPKNYERIFNDSDLLRYLDLKTKAISGNSKSRRNFANIYTIYALLDSYVRDYYNNRKKYDTCLGFTPKELLSFCHKQYGGEKMQAHPLTQRVNTEFENKISRAENKGISIIIKNNKKYLLNARYIYTDGLDLSIIVIKVIKKYISLIKKKDEEAINSLNGALETKDINEMKNKIHSLLTDNSEARIFEIVTFAILKNYYKNLKIYYRYENDELKEECLMLYKTGRTNANDGGIDFVMKPLGKFFQVTEVGNYDKYFLDIDKILHYPITFVIKTKKSKDEIRKELSDYISKKTKGSQLLSEDYNKVIEEIITINELYDFCGKLNDKDIEEVIKDIVKYYKIEMNMSNVKK